MAPDPATLKATVLDLLAQGRPDIATALCRRHLAVGPADGAAIVTAARIQLTVGQWGAARRLAERAVRSAPLDGEAWHALAMALRSLGYGAAAAGALRCALAAAPALASAYAVSGELARRSGEMETTIVALRRACRLAPAWTAALAMLGEALRGADQTTSGIAACQAGLRLDPAHAGLWATLGMTWHEAGDAALACRAYSRALTLAPDLAAVRSNLGRLLADSHGPTPGAAQIERAAALAPGDGDLLANLAAVRLRAGLPGLALTAARCAARCLPEEPSPALHAAGALLALGRPCEAEDWARHAVALAPHDAEPMAVLGTARLRLGDSGPALAALRRAVRLRPGDAMLHSRLLFALDFDPDVDTATLQAAYREWAERHATPPAPAPAIRRGKDGCRLRVGYVSADFRDHSAALVFGPILVHHDRRQFEVVCYATDPTQDERTRQFAGIADLWRPVHGLDDGALAARIRDDGIDILVDLSMHTGGHRLGVFARRPAPVQVTAWGHLSGTGLSVFDALLTDRLVAPPNEAGLFAEPLAHLPCALAFGQPHPLPPVAPAPSERGAPFTFGCCNRIEKLSRATLAAWGAILRAVPNSRFLLKAAEMDDPRTRRRMQDSFAAEGIHDSRLVLLGRTDIGRHLEAHARIDLMLDPFPHGGGVTTLQSLWMGVPVVARYGHKPVERIAASILHALGLDALVADSVEAYQALAIRLAQDSARLAALRPTLRDRLLASPLGDPAAYARAVERIYSDLWHDRRDA